MVAEKVLEKIIVVGLFGVLLVPLIVANSLFFPFITGKAFFFRILIELLFGLWAILAIIQPAYRPKVSGVMFALGGLLLVLVVATVFGANPYRSFWSNFERMDGLISFLHLGAYFVVLISMFKSARAWRSFFYGWLAVAAILSFHSFAQLMGWASVSQGNRINATLGNASYLAVTFLFTIFLTLMLWTEKSQRFWIRILFTVFTLSQIFFLFKTETRGAILGLVGGLLITLLLIAWRERVNLKLRRQTLAGLVAGLIIIFGFVVIKDQPVIRTNQVFGRLANISLAEGQSRFLIWGMAIEGFKEKPIFGWGPENFPLVFDKYYNPKLYNQEQWFDRAHNIFLDWLIHAGVLGLVAYLSLFTFAIYYLWKSKNFSVVKKSILGGLLGAYFFHNIFVFDHLVSYLFFFSLLAYLHTDHVAGATAIITKPNQSKLSMLQRSLVVGGLVVIVVAALYFLNIKPLRANLQLITAISSSSLEGRFLAFNNIFNSKTFASAEAVEHLPNVVGQVWRNQEIDPATKTTWLQFAINILKYEIDKKQTARLPYITGALLQLANQPVLAVEYLEQAKSFSPHKQSILVQLAIVYQQAGEPTKALLTAKEAFELEQANDEARIVYAVLAVLNNELVLADFLAKQDKSPDSRLINAYAEKQQYHKVLELWQRVVTQNPQDTQSRFSLAATYFKLGQLTQAIIELKTVAEINPQLKSQTDQIIFDIQAGRNPLGD